MDKKIVLKIKSSKGKKIRKAWKIKPGLRIRLSRKKEIQAKIRGQEAKDWD